MVRSPHAHARILGIDTSAAEDADQRRRRLHRRRGRRRTGLAANAWPITADQKAPPHPPMAVDRVAFAGEIVAVVVARSEAEARDAAELVDVDYEVLPAALDLKEAAEDTVLAHPDLGTNKSAFWRFDSGEAGTGGSVDEAIAKAARTASSSSGSTASSASSRRSWSPARAGRPDRRADHHVELDPDPARPALPGWRPRRHPGVQAPGDRPRRGWRVRRQAADHPGGVDHFAGVARRLGEARQVDRDPQSRVRWCRATTAATSGRRSRSPPRRTAPSPA